jgi:hypothetical protein
MKESHKIGRAFGYLYDYGEYPAGHVFDDEFIKRGVLKVQSGKLPYRWLFVSGEVEFAPKSGSASIIASRGDTAETLALADGEYMVTARTDARLVCISESLNASATSSLPTVELFRLGAAQTGELDVGAKLLHVDGDLSIRGQVVPPLTSISAKTLAISVLAVSDSLGLRFR